MRSVGVKTKRRREGNGMSSRNRLVLSDKVDSHLLPIPADKEDTVRFLVVRFQCFG